METDFYAPVFETLNRLEEAVDAFEAEVAHLARRVEQLVPEED